MIEPNKFSCWSQDQQRQKAVKICHKKKLSQKSLL